MRATLCAELSIQSCTSDLVLFIFSSSSLCYKFPEHHSQFQRAVWAPHSGQTEAVHPESGHKAADLRGHYGGIYGAEGGLPLS